MSAALDLRALMYACQRVEDFTRVHQGRESLRDRMEAATLWLEYLGLTGETLEFFDQWAKSYSPDETGGLMIGLIIGLFIHEYEREHPRPQ